MGWQAEGEDGTNWQSRTDIGTLHVNSVAKSCLILKPHERYPARRLCPWDFPGSILEWVAMPSSSGSSQPGDQTHLSYIGRQALYHWATRETQHIYPAAGALLQSCLTLCGPRDGSPPGSSIPGILQARILEWVAISFSEIYTLPYVK